jgi:hypothetical protein
MPHARPAWIASLRAVLFGPDAELRQRRTSRRVTDQLTRFLPLAIALARQRRNSAFSAPKDARKALNPPPTWSIRLAPAAAWQPLRTL